MASIANLTALTFSADQLRAMNEIIMEKTLEAPELSLFHDFQTGIRNDREIGISPYTLGLIGKAAQGCNPNADTNTVTVAKKTWTPKRIEFIRDECYSDLTTTMAKLAAKLGVNVNDLTGTEYMNWITDILAKDLPRMIFRHAWMGDQDAAAVDDSPAGNLTAGTDPDYFNVIDGFWVQLAAIYGSTVTRKTTIAANAEATRALQFSALTPTLAATALNSVIDDAPAVLASQPDRLIIATRSVTQKAYRWLQSNGMPYNIELQANGFELTRWDGIPLYTVPYMDELIASYENNGTKLNNPHRILYTTKSNLAIGMEGTGLFDEIKISFDERSRYNRIEASDAFDAKVVQDSLLQVGI